jgi:hypothetical protein
MALVYLRTKTPIGTGSGYIINTKNIESLLMEAGTDILMFRLQSMNGNIFKFNQIFNGDKFVDICDMYQLLSILLKLEHEEKQNDNDELKYWND